jgi:hypothetical protein
VLGHSIASPRVILGRVHAQKKSLGWESTMAENWRASTAAYAAAPAAWRCWPRFENCQRLAVGGDLRPRLQCRFAKKASS